MIGMILFGLLALVAVLSALGMLTSTNAVHAALFLVINLFCIALFYLGLNAPFLAMVQITVYAGAIMVLFIFVIMLLGAERVQLQSRLKWQTPLAITLVVMLIAVTGLVFFSPSTMINITALQPLGEASKTFGGPREIGLELFANYLLPFELTGVLLLVAMIGAVVLAKADKKPAPTQPVEPKS
jgi:NADH-quinone oxidoreductase subunit J